MAMTLHELAGELLELKQMAEDGVIDAQVFCDTFTAVEGDFEQKAEGYAVVIQEWENDIDFLEKEIKRLSNMKKNRETNVLRAKRTLEFYMAITSKKNFKTPLFSFKIKKNPPSLVIDDESKVPEEFVKVKKEIDKVALKKFVKDNENSLDFAHLEQTDSLRIR